MGLFFLFIDEAVKARSLLLRPPSVAGVFEANWRDTELQRLALFMIGIPYLLRSVDSAEKTVPVREYELAATGVDYGSWRRRDRCAETRFALVR